MGAAAHSCVLALATAIECLQVYSVAQCVPADLLARAETEWRMQSRVHQISKTHR
jgi:hypothetical protein